MTLVTLSKQRAVILALDCRVSWHTGSNRQYGQVEFVIPAHSPAWDEEVIDEQGGFNVKVSTPYGKWGGIATEVKNEDAGFRVIAQDFWAYAEVRTVSSNRIFAGVTAGCIARVAVRDAMVGLGNRPFTIGPILEAPPVIMEYAFTGQYLMDVLTDLTERSGHDFKFDADGVFHWVSRLGRSHDITLIDDGTLRSPLQPRPLREQFSESIEVEETGRTFRVYNPSVPISWPSQEVRPVE